MNNTILMAVVIGALVLGVAGWAWSRQAPAIPPTVMPQGQAYNPSPMGPGMMGPMGGSMMRGWGMGHMGMMGGWGHCPCGQYRSQYPSQGPQPPPAQTPK